MDLESITLNEISQTEKDEYCVISLICGIKQTNKNQPHRLVVARECEEGEMSEGRQKVQTFSYKINPGDVMYSMVVTVNNSVPCI